MIASIGLWPEEFHLVAHFLVCGGVALLVAEIGHGLGRPIANSVFGGLVTGIAVGLGIEVVQYLDHPPPFRENLYDLAVDAWSVGCGLALWSLRNGRLREYVGHVLSALFHPLWVAPLGFAVTLFAATRDLQTSAEWTLIAIACLLPCVIVWAVGVGLHWFSDADVSQGVQRPPLLAIGLAGLGVLAALTLTGPESASLAASAAFVGTLGGMALTMSGLKVSGHVAIPVALGILVAAWSPRAAGLLVAVAILLSWARYAAHRHWPSEVAAAWGLGTFSVLMVSG